MAPGGSTRNPGQSRGRHGPSAGFVVSSRPLESRTPTPAPAAESYRSYLRLLAEVDPHRPVGPGPDPRSNRWSIRTVLVRRGRPNEPPGSGGSRPDDGRRPADTAAATPPERSLVAGSTGRRSAEGLADDAQPTQAIRHEQLRALAEALDALPEDQRQAIRAAPRSVARSAAAGSEQPSPGWRAQGRGRGYPSEASMRQRDRPVRPRGPARPGDRRLPRRDQGRPRRSTVENCPEFFDELSDFFADRDAVGARGTPARRTWPGRSTPSRTPTGWGPRGARPPRLGPYEVVDRVGRGGMGVVARGTTRRRRFVAIKAMAPQWASDPAARVQVHPRGTGGRGGDHPPSSRSTPSASGRVGRTW